MSSSPVVPVVEPLFPPVPERLVITVAGIALVTHQLFVEVLGRPGEELGAQGGLGQVQTTYTRVTMTPAGMTTTNSATSYKCNMVCKTTDVCFKI